MARSAPIKAKHKVKAGPMTPRIRYNIGSSLKFDFFLNVLGAGFGGALFSARRVALVNRVGEDHLFRFGIDNLNASLFFGGVGPEEEHLSPACFFGLGHTGNDEISFVPVGDHNQRHALLLNGGG